MTTVSVSPPDSSARAGASPAEPDIQFVVCVVAGERYGMEVGRVHEIIRMPAITAPPGADRTFSGVINLRGRSSRSWTCASDSGCRSPHPRD